MKLADMVGLKNWTPHPTPAEIADSAEIAQPCGLRSPQPLAENCGKAPDPCGIRRNPQLPAESETPALTDFQAKSANPQNPQPLPSVAEPALAITREHFAGLGVQLLADDLAFLRWHLPRATAARNAAVREYVRRWHEAMDAEPVKYRKDNVGRQAANTWLRTDLNSSPP